MSSRPGPGGTRAAGRSGPRVLVVGSGWRFTSGISYYTCRLTNALSEVTPTDALLMRRLVPTALYPGRARVGQSVNDVDYRPEVRVHDGVDWYWGRSMRQARRFIAEQQPDVVILQWWTGAVLHSYLRLAALAKRHGARVVMEWHEVQDTGEARIPGVVRYVRKAMGQLLDRVDAHVVHSRYDLDLLRTAYGLDDSVEGAVTIVPHGPYDHVNLDPSTGTGPTASLARGGDEAFNILFFGIIRPYQGLEDTSPPSRPCRQRWARASGSPSSARRGRAGRSPSPPSSGAPPATGSRSSTATSPTPRPSSTSPTPTRWSCPTAGPRPQAPCTWP